MIRAELFQAFRRLPISPIDGYRYSRRELIALAGGALILALRRA